MPRNRSEKSPSGDTIVDDYLRAWLRWWCHLRGDQADLDELTRERERTRTLLTHQQLNFMDTNLASNGHTLCKDDVARLYGREPEFQGRFPDAS